MKYCDICGGDFYVQERWDGGEWRLVLYNDTEMSPEEVNCAECPKYLPLEEGFPANKLIGSQPPPV